MGRFSTITLEECIAVAKLRLKIKTTDEDIALMEFCNEAVRHLDTNSIFLKSICVLDIEDNKSKLPCGFHNIIALRFGSGNSCQELIYADLDYMRECGCTTPSNVVSGVGVFEIQNGWIHYHTVPDNTTEATLSYWGLNVDSNGRGIIYETYRRAVVSYVCYLYCLQNNGEREYANQIEQHLATWVAQKKWIKSEDAVNTFRQTRHQTRSIMNGLIADKRNWRTI